MAKVGIGNVVKVLFFARLREQLGAAEQMLEWSKDDTVLTLAKRLIADGGERWQVLLAEDTVVAQNQTVVSRDSLVRDGDEIAFFPPVTGG